MSQLETMQFTLTEALLLFWSAWDYKLSPGKKVLPPHLEHSTTELTDYIIREITYRAEEKRIPSPLENFKGLHVH